jgi:polyhydroxybutyrate depolymerase
MTHALVRIKNLGWVLPILLALQACGGGGGDTTAAQPTTPAETAWTATKTACASPGSSASCTVAGFEARPYRVYVPSQPAITQARPVVVLFHGGTGNAFAGALSTCATDASGRADAMDSNCLDNVAEREGFVAVYPNGTGTAAAPESRTFNAGGGSGGWQCVGGAACNSGIDEEAYVAAVLDDVNAWAAGLSNGAALAHRVACSMSERFAAIASVGGGNQYATVASCTPSQPVAILQIHGDADPCWTYDESSSTCAAGAFGRKIGAYESARAWASRLACTGEPTSTAEPDTDGNALGTVAVEWPGCSAPVTLLKAEGVGHTWPSGFQYGAANVIGPVGFEIGTPRMWEFFSMNRRP